MYIVLDSLDNPLRRFPSYRQAMTFKIAMQRYDWKIRKGGI
jgi:hypothetical protein